MSEKSSDFPHLSKRIFNDDPNDILINFLPLRNELEQAVMPYGETFGFYFEYLPTGTSIGVNEDGKFHAASLFKVPLVMAHFRYNERTGETDEREITIEEKHLDSRFGNLWKRGAGEKIILSEAVKLAITESDNTAIHIVSEYLEQEDIGAVYEGLDMDYNIEDDNPLITARGFSSVLKALFFSSVLTKENSEKLLSLLSQTRFKDMLPSGVGTGVRVAHKIGQFDMNTYMDCGIVYIPKRPYVLCMVSVSDEETAKIRMKELSKKVYTFITTEESETPLFRTK